MNIQTSNTNPNFTIILPGPCNAKCSFCTWEKDSNPKGFLNGLEYALKNLPVMFQQISISGGEPTLSPYLRETLAIIKNHRDKFKKVVLTTNGTKLFASSLYNGITLNDLEGVVDHINISRHSPDDSINKEVFGTSNIPETKDLYNINQKLLTSWAQGAFDLNYNCVLVPGIEQDPLQWIKFMKNTRIKSVTFRNQYDIDIVSPIEQLFRDSHLVPRDKSECPVCRTTSYTDDGYSFKFHSSAYEPIKIFNGLNIRNETYEVILQSNGNITRDWGGKSILYRAEPTMDNLNHDKITQAEYNDYPEEQRVIQDRLEISRAMRNRMKKAEMSRAIGITSYDSCGISALTYGRCH